jgi:hypothetical protein
MFPVNRLGGSFAFSGRLGRNLALPGHEDRRGTSRIARGVRV